MKGLLDKTSEKKKRVLCTISVHWVQADIISGLQSGKINLSKHTLRDIAEIIKVPDTSPQKIKHHLFQLVKLGVIQIINAEYSYVK